MKENSAGSFNLHSTFGLTETKSLIDYFIIFGVENESTLKSTSSKRNLIPKVLDTYPRRISSFIQGLNLVLSLLNNSHIYVLRKDINLLMFHAKISSIRSKLIS